MFSLIYAWINGWVNNRKASDTRRHRAHYDFIVMYTILADDHAIKVSRALINHGITIKWTQFAKNISISEPDDM